MNVVGFCEPLLINFGATNGVTARILPEGDWWTFAYSTGLLIFCTGICLVGSSLFAKAGKVLFVTLLVSTFTIPLSVLFVQPFQDARFGGAAYTGFAWKTVRENLFPRFTKGAAGSMIKSRETFQDMFAIFFPATCGIFAGASMSGDLKTPSSSIPQGTLRGLMLTYCSYSLVILAMGCCISRDLLYRDVQVLQNVNMSKYLIILGEFSTSLFSAIVGIIGSAKQLQALAKDDLLPFTKRFAKGTPVTDDPINAVIFTYILAQITLLFDINQIATFITMAFLMTFVVTNLACFLLKIASAPNFRPSFKYFNTYTAGAGAAASVAAMFVADGVSASLMIIVLIVLFMVIHYISLPKPWGDVSQALIYHQVRKYLLRLRQDHVKFWRPQILLLVDDPRSAWKLIHFCNHLKKGGLYILGHVVTTQDFQQSFAEVKKQQSAWIKLRDISKVKAFVQIAAGPDVVWGARNVYMGSGLGGMRPNITVLGFFETRNHIPTPGSTSEPTEFAIPMEPLPTDACRRETTINVMQWVNIIEDLLTMRANIAIAKGFPNLELPNMSGGHVQKESKRKYIDLYPIQMSAQIIDENGETSALTTNFDTYTLILQMGAILRTVPAWKANHDLRVVVFVEFEEDVEEERYRIKILLERLRINAEILVLCLSGGNVEAYETIVHGLEDKSGRVEKFLGKHEWWLELQDARKEWANKYANNDQPTGYIPQDRVEGLMQTVDNGFGIGSVSVGNQDSSVTPSTPGEDHKKLQRNGSPPLSAFLKNRKRRHTISSLQKMGLSGFNIQTNKLSKSDLKHATDFYRDIESSSDEDELAVNSAYDSVSSSSNTSQVKIPELFKVQRRLTSPSFHRQEQPSSLPGGPNITKKQKDAVPSNKYDSETSFGRKSVSSGSSASPESMLKKSLLSLPMNSNPPISEPHTPSGASPSKSGTSTPLSQAAAKKRKPNFSGLAMPNTMVDEEAEDGRPTIMFENKKGVKTTSLSSLSGISGGGSSTNIAGIRPGPSRSRSGTLKKEVMFASMNERTPLMGEKKKTSDEMSILEEGKHVPPLKVGFGSIEEIDDDRISKNGGMGWDDEDGGEYDPEEREGAYEDESFNEEDPDGKGAYLSFNHLPANAQHVILNDMMRTTSKDAVVIFSTLPAPALGTHLSEEESWQYVESLDLWCQDLPPVILLHSQTMTVTTAL